MWLFLYPPPTGHVVGCMRIGIFTIKPTYTRKVWPTATRFGIVTSVGRGTFLEGHVRSLSQASEPWHRQFF